jgi:1-acyl-sn-glycerol-3-phosphate acyltransferase
MIRFIFKLYFKLTGWKLVGTFPYDVKKAVCILAPHTSNYDFVIAVMSRALMGVKAKYLAKKELFDSTFGFLFYWSGGIPVDRKNHHHLTEQIINSSTKHGNFYIAITPEGTRKRVTKWKTGFYNIAVAANIPIICFAIDYKTKEFRIGPVFYPAGDYKKDLEFFKELYSKATPRHPENWSADFE